MKRFYTLVSHDVKDDAGFAILLDGKPVKTQSGKVLLAPTQGIADLAVQEWARQVDIIDPETMPITQILNTKLDQVALKREVMSDAVMRYLDTDLLFYVASEPEGLVVLQDKKWGVWRSWIEEWFGVSVETTSGLGALKQSESYRDKVREIVSKMNDDEFTLFQILVPLTGSIILSLALLQGKAKAEEVLAATFLEEDFKETLYDAEKYGTDPHIEARQKAALRDLNACERYLMSL